MQKKQDLQVSFVDRPEVSETFADSVRSIHFDGQTMRMELCSTRLDRPDPSIPPTAMHYPVCRLVLTPTATIDLFNKLQQVIAHLEKSGAVKKTTVESKTIQ